MMLGMFALSVGTLSAPKSGDRTYGWRPAPPTDPTTFRKSDPAPYPTNLEWPVQHQVTDTGPVLDQGSLGSCGPNAMASVLMHAGYPLPSRLFIYYETRSVMGTIPFDSGVDNKSMTTAVTDQGWPDEKVWEYDPLKVFDEPTPLAYTDAAARRGAKFAKVPLGDVNAIKANLWANRPVLIGFLVYESFETDDVRKSGVVPMPTDDDYPLGGHDVLIVGWNDMNRTFLFKNSYGKKWGTRGYGTLPYDYVADPKRAQDFWVLVTKP